MSEPINLAATEIAYNLIQKLAYNNLTIRTLRITARFEFNFPVNNPPDRPSSISGDEIGPAPSE